MEHPDLYKLILDHTYEGVYLVDENRQITFWNKGAERISGFSSAEVVGKYCFENILSHVDNKGSKLCLAGCPLHQTILDGATREAEIYLQHKDGHRVPVSTRTVAITEDNKVIGAIELFVDSTQRHEDLKTTEKCKTLALMDQLTNLPNRRYIDAFLELKFNEYHSFGVPFGLLFVDVDQFKVFNDTRGHVAGDGILKLVAQTCSGITQTNGFLGRLGGDEFLSVLVGASEESIKAMGETIRMLVENSNFKDKGEALEVTVSIGATLIREGDSIKSIMERADSLLYQSKLKGRNQVTYG